MDDDYSYMFMNGDQEEDACTCPEHLFTPIRPPYLKRETQDLGRKPEDIYANIKKSVQAR